MKLLDLNQADFCRECGIKDATISSMGDNLSTANVIRIARRYPNLNLRWLLLGDSPIWLEDESGSPVLQPTFVPSRDDSEVAFLRDMVKRQHDTLQILIRNIEKNYKPNDNE